MSKFKSKFKTKFKTKFKSKFKASRMRWILLGSALTVGAAQAGELRVNAPVVDVEPITGPVREVEYCDDKPTDAALSALLAWDLGLNCRVERIESQEVTGYRVFYRWDDRVYSQIMASAPGATVPLKVRIE